MRRFITLCLLATFVTLLGGCAMLHPASESPYMQKRETDKSYN